MDQGDWGIVLGIISVGLAIVGIAVTLVFKRRRVAAPHWTDPTWIVDSMTSSNIRMPVLTVRWAVRGSRTIQGVECAVRSPGGSWQVCAAPKGQLEPPRENLYTYINLVDGTPFNTLLTSPADYGKPAEDTTHRAVKGKYQLRIRWHEPDRPKRRRQKTFSYTVTRPCD